MYVCMYTEAFQKRARLAKKKKNSQNICKRVRIVSESSTSSSTSSSSPTSETVSSPKDDDSEWETDEDDETGDFETIGGNPENSPPLPPSPSRPLQSPVSEREGEARDSAEIENYLNNFKDIVGEYSQELTQIADFNFPINKLDFDVVKNVLEKVFAKIRARRVVISLEVGYLLRHSFTGELRYFFASWNTLLGKRKFTLTASRESLNKVLIAFRNLDFQSYLLTNRMSSPWLLMRATNLRCIVQFLDVEKQNPFQIRKPS